MRIGMRVDKALVEINGLPLTQLINIAFKVKPYQVVAPSWMTQGNFMTQDRFDIRATMPEGATKDDVPQMLQALLAERFKLTYHRDSAELPVYALTVAKGGAKLKDAPPEQPTTEGDADKQGVFSGRPDAKGGMSVRGPNGNMKMQMQDGVMHMEVERATIPMFVDMISGFVDKPVVDETDLKGAYTISLELSMSDMMNAARAQGVTVGGPPGGGGGGGGGPAVMIRTDGGGGTPGGGGGAAGDAPDPGSASIFRTIQKLGLKLDPKKAPIGKIIIDHLEKTPTEN